MKILIIGAGPCGLGAAYRLEQLGYWDWQVFERNSYVGGLSASFFDDLGFTWNVGGHVLFSHYEYSTKLFPMLWETPIMSTSGRAGFALCNAGYRGNLHRDCR